jgi:hypothetical protein
LIAEVGGVGREHPLSMEKLSPILAFYMEDDGARRRPLLRSVELRRDGPHGGHPHTLARKS